MSGTRYDRESFIAPLLVVKVQVPDRHRCPRRHNPLAYKFTLKLVRELTEKVFYNLYIFLSIIFRLYNYLLYRAVEVAFFDGFSFVIFFAATADSYDYLDKPAFGEKLQRNNL